MCRRQCELHIGRIEMVQAWGPNTLIERMATKKPKHGNPCHETRFFSIWNGTPTCQSLQMFQGYLTLGPPQASVLMGFPTPFMAIMMILLEGKLGWTRDGIWCFYYPCIWRHASSIRSLIAGQERKKNMQFWEQLVVFKAQWVHSVPKFIRFGHQPKKFTGTLTTSW